MKLVPRFFTSLAVATTTALSLSATASAVTLSSSLEFNTSNQSIWDTGNALNIKHDKFLGLEWDKSVGKNYTIPNVIPGLDEECVDTYLFGEQCIYVPTLNDLDIGFNAFTNGKVGLQSILNLDGGTVSASIPVDLFLTLPDQPINPGETVTIQSGFSFGSGANFTTSSPRGSYALDLIFRLAAGIDVNPGSTFDYNWEIDQTTNLISFDSDDLNFQAGGSLGSIEVHFPKVDTVGTLAGSNQISSSGQDKFINGALDLDQIVTTLLSLPPLEGDVSIDLGIAGNLGFNYNLLDATAMANLGLLQNFSLTGTLPALLSLENGTTIPFNVGDNITFTMPTDVDGPLDINAVLNLNALFSNTTSLELDIVLEVLAGKFGLDIPFLGNQSVGPLYEDSVNLFSPSFDLYNNTFNLAGFNQQSFSFQVPVAFGTGGTGGNGGTGGTGGTGGNGGNGDTDGSEVRVPEPGNTVVSLVMGLVGFSVLRRRMGFKKIKPNSFN